MLLPSAGGGGRRGGRHGDRRPGDLGLRRAASVLNTDLQVAMVRLQVRLCAPLLEHDLPGRPEDLIVHNYHNSQRDIKRP